MKLKTILSSSKEKWILLVDMIIQQLLEAKSYDVIISTSKIHFSLEELKIVLSFIS